MTTDTPLQWNHLFSSIGRHGLPIERQATEDERDRLRASLDIVSVEQFDTRYKISAQSGGSFVFAGDFRAKVRQACVVTLEPVAQDVLGTFSVTFFPPGRSVEPSEKAGDKERPVLDAPDTEVLYGDSIDAGRVLFELLGAALDPYPRKAGAEFDWQDPKAGPDEAEMLHPFAALSKLKGGA